MTKSIEDGQESHTVAVSDDASNVHSHSITYSYEIRGLSEEEMPIWAAFCASVFAYKADPPSASYFERHYWNDPTRGTPRLIRVAMYHGQIVASCRLFLRSISQGVTTKGGLVQALSAGGIGEVCTSNDHRRRGLSKVLLQNVIDIMQERQLQLSLLHAAPAFFRVYEKAGGYTCTTSRWSNVPVRQSQLVTCAALEVNTNNAWKIRDVFFPQDTPYLSKLHEVYSEQRFSGCIVRSNDYWNQYLSVELKGSLWVLENNGAIVAWLSLRPRGDRFQLRDFGLDQRHEVASSSSLAFTILLAHAVQQTQSIVTNQWTLSLPTIVLDEIRSDENKDHTAYFDWNAATSDNDSGWMYKILDQSISLDSINGSSSLTPPHLIWPADSF